MSSSHEQAESQPLEVLVEQQARLKAVIEQEREQIEALEELIHGMVAQRQRHEYLLRQVESVLGKTPQIQLEDSSIPLRGQRISEVAVQVLADERGEDAEIHYTEWFEMLKLHGHFVAGKNPVNTFLTQINRSSRVQRVGSRTGRYRLLDKVA